MGIETLQKAAAAAGYAMATPDDDPPTMVATPETPPRREMPRSTGQWLVPVASEPVGKAPARDGMSAAAAWIRNHLPAMGGGRAPA